MAMTASRHLRTKANTARSGSWWRSDIFSKSKRRDRIPPRFKSGPSASISKNSPRLNDREWRDHLISYPLSVNDRSSSCHFARRSLHHSPSTFTSPVPAFSTSHSLLITSHLPFQYVSSAQTEPATLRSVVNGHSFSQKDKVPARTWRRPV